MKLPSSPFFRAVALLVGGTAFAHAIQLAAMPVLTRIYSPTEFGLLAVFVAILGMLSVVASLRYEIAIPLPDSDVKAASLLSLSLFFVLTTSFVVAAVVFFFATDLANLFGKKEFAKYLWLLPVGVFMTGLYQIFQFWATRKKAYRSVAQTKIGQALAGAGTQILLGFSGFGALGLMLGQVVSNAAGFIGLAHRAWTGDKLVFKKVNRLAMRETAIEYIKYPKFSTLEALTNTAGSQIPMILIASLTFGAEAGFLLLALKMLQVPMALMGRSISQVYFVKAVDEFRNKNLAQFTLSVIGNLAKIGVGPLIFAGLVAPKIFSILFGAQWERSGELVAWLVPWFVLEFLTSPISFALHVAARQKLAFALQLFGLAIRVGSVIIAAYLLAGKHASEIYGASCFIFYSVYLMVICQVVQIKLGDFMRIIFKSLPVIILWIAAGLAILFYFK